MNTGDRQRNMERKDHEQPTMANRHRKTTFGFRILIAVAVIGLVAAGAGAGLHQWSGSARAATPLKEVGVNAGVFLRRYLPLSLAQRAANAALGNCSKRGYPVAATVVDNEGLVIVQLHADGASGSNRRRQQGESCSICRLSCAIRGSR